MAWAFIQCCRVQLRCSHPKGRTNLALPNRARSATQRRRPYAARGLSGSSCPGQIHREGEKALLGAIHRLRLSDQRVTMTAVASMVGISLEHVCRRYRYLFKS
jgi:hypothetical protein